jgi:SAM-dependent methyltransferase
MASSFIEQLPAIIHIIEKLAPKNVLDIGKGFGKYGFLIHEYVGIDNKKKLDPKKSLKDLSHILIDAVEVDEDLILPHLSHLYTTIYFGDVLKLYKDFPVYDLILMVDIIEHIDKKEALNMLKYFLKNGSKILIATPKLFFEQELYESEFEHHVSHWTINDFEKLGNCSSQNINAGTIYLLSNEKIDIRGFGNSAIKKLRRIARAIKNEF